MMKKLFLLPVLLMLSVTNAYSRPAVSDIEKLKSNYREILIPSYSADDSLYNDFLRIEPEVEMSDQIVMELHQKYPFDLRKIDGYLALMKPDGSFSDIDYADKKRSGWEPKLHAERVLELTKLYYSKDSERYKSPQLKADIHKALGYWLKEKPKCLNWWQNEIGVPKTLGGAFIMLDDELSDEERAGAIEIMSAARFKMTGQNKVWLAGNVLIRAIMQEDVELIKAARDTIASEIRVGAGEGIQPDWSFHQHGPQQQFGNYGMSFVSGMSFFKRLFEGTSYRFDDRQTEILESLMNEGYRWVVWKRYMDINSLGRQLFHNAQIHKGYATAFVATDMGLAGYPAESNDLVGHKHFYSSDFTVHRTPGWMATLKMSSSRIIGSELVNEDNVKGYYLGDGATYYYVRGDEYLNVFPFWNWRNIPGITSYQGSEELPSIRATKSRNSSGMVGGIDVGDCGMSVMDFCRDGLTARKAWIFAPDFVVCIGAGINSDSIAEVTTTIDQRLKRGNLELLENGRWVRIDGAKAYSGHQTVYHDNTAYITMGDTPLTLKSEHRIGQWHDNMRMYRPKDVEGDVVELLLSHGAKPRNGNYAYIVMPDCYKSRAKNFNAAKEVRLLRNDSAAQVIHLPEVSPGYWAAVYVAGELLDLDGKKYLAEEPGIYYIETAGSGSTVKVCSKF